MKDATEKIDGLEMENYMLRDLVAELAKHLEDYDSVIKELLSYFDGE